MKYKSNFDRRQPIFFPETVNDYIDEEHLARFVDMIIVMLDFKGLDSKYQSFGQRAYDPRSLTAVIFYGYSIGIYSSRKIEDACIHRFDFRFLTNNLLPSYKTISEFRRKNLDFLKEKFSEIVLIGVKMGAVSIGNIKISIDGTKIKANASSKKTKDLKHLQLLKERIEDNILELLNKAEAIDKDEDHEKGDSTQRKISKKIMSRQSEIKSIQKTISALKEKIELDKAEAVRKKKKPLSKSETAKIENQKMNITDHDAKFMKDRNGCTRSNYNAQISVDEKNQFILSNDVTTCSADQNQLQNMVEQTEDKLKNKIDLANADAGYETKENLNYMEDRDIEYYIESCRRNVNKSDKLRYNKINFEFISEKDSYLCAEGNLLPFYKTGKENGKDIRKYRCKKWIECPFRDKCCRNEAKTISRCDDDYLLENNLKKMQSPEAREKYAKRKQTVEPVFGTMKFNRKFITFLLRGIDKIRGEFSILCTSFNIRKLHNLSLSHVES